MSDMLFRCLIRTEGQVRIALISSDCLRNEQVFAKNEDVRKTEMFEDVRRCSLSSTLVNNRKVNLSKALEIAIQMEMGAQNQQKINQNLLLATNSVNVVHNYQTHNLNRNAQQLKRDLMRYPTVPQNYQFSSICMNCGLRWSHNH